MNKLRLFLYTSLVHTISIIEIPPYFNIRSNDDTTLRFTHSHHLTHKVELRVRGILPELTSNGLTDWLAHSLSYPLTYRFTYLHTDLPIDLPTDSPTDFVCVLGDLWGGIGILSGKIHPPPKEIAGINNSRLRICVNLSNYYCYIFGTFGVYKIKIYLSI